MVAGFLAARPLGYENGHAAASEILGHTFDGELTEVEFADSPPIAIFPGGASEWRTWVVLELRVAQATKFEQTLKESAEWHAMPLPEKLLVYGEGWLQPGATLAGIEIKEKLPTANKHGFYLFDGDLANGTFIIAIYDPETRRLFVNAIDQ